MKDAIWSMMYATIYRLYDMIYEYEINRKIKKGMVEILYEYKSIIFNQIWSKYK